MDQETSTGVPLTCDSSAPQAEQALKEIRNQFLSVQNAYPAARLDGQNVREQDKIKLRGCLDALMSLQEQMSSRRETWQSGSPETPEKTGYNKSTALFGEIVKYISERYRAP